MRSNKHRNRFILYAKEIPPCRDGETISRSLLTMLISMLSTISSLSHNIIFATPYIASSKAYYDQEGHRLLGGPSSDSATVISTSEQQVLPIPAYLTHIKHRLAEEAERCDLVVGQSLKGDIIRAVEESLVQAHTATMIQRGLSNLLDEERMDDLSTIYSLFGRVRALLPLRTAFGEHVTTRGSAIIADTARDDAMVDRLIAFQSSVGGIISRAFASDADFVHASREAFKVAVNARQNKPAEMIAKYIDAKMRSGNKAMSDEELENTFRSVLTLFRYCQGKDIFEAFYKKDFAKRLLLNKSASSDAEKNMLLKLKEGAFDAFPRRVVRASWTELLFMQNVDRASPPSSRRWRRILIWWVAGGLVTPVRPSMLTCYYRPQSADIMKAYKEHLDASASPDSLLSVNILTSGNWPSYSRQPVRIPEDLQKELDRFGRFYKAKYAGRSLTFMHSLDQCTLKAEFKKGPGGGKKELNVSFHQAVVLLLFADSAPASGEEEAKIGFKDIVAQTGLGECALPVATVRRSSRLTCLASFAEEKEAMRTLQSLACAKQKVLTKHPKGRDVAVTDEFSFNAGFTDDKFRLRINQIQQKETVEEARATTSQVLLDRQSHLQLVIVRILKSRKTVKHQELVMEVVRTLKERFRVDPPEIKKAVDSLIERDYMERAEGTRDTYNYLVSFCSFVAPGIALLTLVNRLASALARHDWPDACPYVYQPVR